MCRLKGSAPSGGRRLAERPGTGYASECPRIPRRRSDPRDQARSARPLDAQERIGRNAAKRAIQPSPRQRAYALHIGYRHFPQKGQSRENHLVRTLPVLSRQRYVDDQVSRRRLVRTRDDHHGASFWRPGPGLPARLPQAQASSMAFSTSCSALLDRAKSRTSSSARRMISSTNVRTCDEVVGFHSANLVSSLRPRVCIALSYGILDQISPLAGSALLHPTSLGEPVKLRVQSGQP